MNTRRDFLKLCTALPLALPAIVSTCGQVKPKPFSLLHDQVKPGSYPASKSVTITKGNMNIDFMTEDVDLEIGNNLLVTDQNTPCINGVYTVSSIREL